MSEMLYRSVESPLGELLLVGADDSAGERLHGLYMRAGRRPIDPRPGWQARPGAFAGVERQLGEYFAGERTSFDVALELQGTDFQRAVWRGLCEIPYGATTSYGELARRIGRPHAVRAVGLANGRNPVSVIVPCHRVIGADGSLTGYGGGLVNKRLLLDLEAGAARLPGTG